MPKTFPIENFISGCTEGCTSQRYFHSYHEEKDVVVVAEDIYCCEIRFIFISFVRFNIFST